MACGLLAFAASGLFLLAAWLPAYYTQLTGLPARHALAIHTICMAVLTASVPLGGLLADKFGRTSLLLCTCVAAGVFCYPAWLLFELAVPSLSGLLQLLLVLFVGLHWGGVCPAVTERFPRQVRLAAGVVPPRGQQHCMHATVRGAAAVMAGQQRAARRQAAQSLTCACVPAWVHGRCHNMQVRCSALALGLVLPVVLLGSLAPLAALGLVMRTRSLASPAVIMLTSSAVTAATVTLCHLRRQRS